MEFIFKIIRLIYVFIFPPKKEDIPKEIFGVNCFFNRSDLGTIKEQAIDIKETLDIQYVRVLFHYSDAFQKDKLSGMDFSFNDDIINNLEPGMKAVVVLTGLPSWAELDELPYKHFIRFCKKVFDRYKDNENIIGYQIGNEPNHNGFPENVAMNFHNPKSYIAVLATVYEASKQINPDKKIISAATTSIIQNYPSTLNYNKLLIKGGVLHFCDVFAIHYYGDDYLNYLRPDGALDFLESVDKPIWITEIGSKDFNRHLSYAKEKIPYLIKTCDKIQLVIWYQYDGGGETESYGLRMSGSDAQSPLYFHLKNSK